MILEKLTGLMFARCRAYRGSISDSDDFAVSLGDNGLIFKANLRKLRGSEGILYEADCVITPDGLHDLHSKGFEFSRLGLFRKWSLFFSYYLNSRKGDLINYLPRR